MPLAVIGCGALLAYSPRAHADPTTATTSPDDDGGDAEPGDATAPDDGAATPASPDEPSTASPTGARRPTQVIDFGEEEAFGPGEVMTGRERDDIEFGSLLRDRHRRLLAARGDAHATAPPPAPRRFRVNIRAGIGFATISGNLSDATARISGGAGASVAVAIGESFTLEPGLWYAAKGATLADNGAIHYLSAPVLLSYWTGAPNFRLKIGAGPSVGRALSSQFAGVDIERWEFGAVVELGSQIATGSGAFTLAVRLERALTRVFPGQGVHNNQMALTAGYSF